VNKIPETWGIPNDQAKKLREALSRKISAPEDILHNAIEEIARDIATIEPDPVDWAWWVGFLVTELEGQSIKKNVGVQFQQMLNLVNRKIEELKSYEKKGRP
jgi:hypothetical protein